MRQKSRSVGSHGEKAVMDIRRATRKQNSAEEKIRIGLDGLIDQTYRLSVVWRASAEL